MKYHAIKDKLYDPEGNIVELTPENVENLLNKLLQYKENKDLIERVEQILYDIRRYAESMDNNIRDYLTDYILDIINEVDKAEDFLYKIRL